MELADKQYSKMRRRIGCLALLIAGGILAIATSYEREVPVAFGTYSDTENQFALSIYPATYKLCHEQKCTTGKARSFIVGTTLSCLYAGELGREFALFTSTLPLRSFDCGDQDLNYFENWRGVFIRVGDKHVVLFHRTA